MTAGPPQPDTFGFALFPGDERAKDISRVISPEKVIVRDNFFLPGAKSIAPIVVLGCIQYQFTFDGGYHYSRFMYVLKPAMPPKTSDVYPYIPLDLNGIATRDQLLLELYYGPGSFDSD